jgi:hypothetical protein
VKGKKVKGSVRRDQEEKGQTLKTSQAIQSAGQDHTVPNDGD